MSKFFSWKDVEKSDLKELFLFDLKCFGVDLAFTHLQMVRYINKNILFKKVFLNKNIIGIILIVVEKRNAYIANIAVEKEFRKLGVANYLLKNGINQINETTNYNKLTLHVDCKNKSAIKLYKKFGFNTVKKVMHCYGVDKHGYYMELMLKND